MGLGLLVQSEASVSRMLVIISHSGSCPMTITWEARAMRYAAEPEIVQLAIVPNILFQPCLSKRRFVSSPRPDKNDPDGDLKQERQRQQSWTLARRPTRRFGAESGREHQPCCHMQVKRR